MKKSLSLNTKSFILERETLANSSSSIYVVIYENSGWLSFPGNKTSTVAKHQKPRVINGIYSLLRWYLFVCTFAFGLLKTVYEVNSYSYIDNFISMPSSSSNQIGKFFVLSSGQEALLPHFPSFSLHGTVVNKGNQKQDRGHYLYSQSDFTYISCFIYIYIYLYR